jgi:hypothetical protein
MLLFNIDIRLPHSLLWPFILMLLLRDPLLEMFRDTSFLLADIPNSPNVEGGREFQIIVIDNARSSIGFHLVKNSCIIDKNFIPSKYLASLISVHLEEPSTSGNLLAGMVLENEELAHVCVAFEQVVKRSLVSG